MAKYQTKQRKKLLEYLECHTDELLSVEQIAKALANDNISVSAIYRNFAKLESEGKVRKASRTGERNIYYQYIAAEHCRESLHLNCKKCGKSYHLNAQLAETITKGLLSTEKFEIDIANTVIYGICDVCAK